MGMGMGHGHGHGNPMAAAAAVRPTHPTLPGGFLVRVNETRCGASLTSFARIPDSFVIAVMTAVTATRSASSHWWHMTRAMAGRKASQVES